MEPSASIFTPTNKRRRRKRREPKAAAPPTALRVLSAAVVEFDADIIRVNVVFDTTAAEPLAGVGGAAPAKWTARYQGLGFAGILIALENFDTLQITLSSTEAEAGADVISYANAPSDIFDALGRSLAAFQGFPLAS